MHGRRVFSPADITAAIVELAVQTAPSGHIGSIRLIVRAIRHQRRKTIESAIDSAVTGGGQVSGGNTDIGIERSTDVASRGICELDVQMDRRRIDGLDRNNGVRCVAGCLVGIGICVGTSMSHIVIIRNPSAALIDQPQINAVIGAIDAQANEAISCISIVVKAGGKLDVGKGAGVACTVNRKCVIVRTNIVLLKYS